MNSRGNGMNDEPEQIDADEQNPKVTYLRVYLLSAVLIVLGLQVISWRIAFLLGVVLMPAHAIAIGLVSRIKPFRPVLLKIWPVTALVISLLFLMPGHVIYRLAMTPEAVFKRLVANPIPDSVENIEKKQGTGVLEWVSLTFDADSKTITEIFETHAYQPLEKMEASVQEQAGRFEFGRAKAFRVVYPDGGIQLTAIINARSNRMCVIYERPWK